MSGGDTIYALSSAPGRAGVAVVRISGPKADMLCRDISGTLPNARRATLRGLRSVPDAALIDRALVIRFPGPDSYTGEDIVEFQIHGGRAVLDALFGVLAGFDDVRLAEPGEFSRRAFVNGRMELTQAEGIADLIAAETEGQRQIALAQADGALARLHGGWRARLLRQLAHIEAYLDFPDEDLPGDVLSGLIAEIADLTAALEDHLGGAQRGERLRDGVTVAIVGAPNAGKSTLLNVLAQRDVAIVSDTPGTTRDALEVHLDLGGWPVVLVDTAGLRDSADRIEQEGVRRAVDRAATADLVISMKSAGAESTDGAGEDYLSGLADPEVSVGPKVIHLLSQTDRADKVLLSEMTGDFDLAISAATGAGMAELVERLSAEAGELLSDRGGVLPTRVRHRQGLEETVRHLRRAEAWTSDNEPELLAEDLRLAIRALGRIAGVVDVEDLLDVIFRDFCIGK